MNRHGAVVRLGDLMLERGGTTDPSKHVDETFALYSIPAFDIGKPESVLGREIGSSKKNVQTDDVLLSRIVPHIRRAWVVGYHQERAIASGEWIVFRDRRVYPSYLRHFLVSDVFHAQFMMTVAGVGGSLLRARPNDVARITLPLPPLGEQRRIAAILDKADALRRKRKRALDLLDGLTQSIFFEMFGDTDQNHQRSHTVELGDLIAMGPSNGLYKPSSAYGSGTPILRINNFYDGEVVDLRELRRLEVDGDELRRFGLEPDDIVINRVNSREYVGKSALVPALAEPTVFESNMMRFRVQSDIVRPGYCIHALQMNSTWRQMQSKVKDAINQSSINQKDVRSLRIVLPPVERQDQFLRAREKILAIRQAKRFGGGKSDGLFASLQSRAFSGQL